MEARSPARYLAPIAIVVTIGGAYLIVHHSATKHASTSRALHTSAARGTRTTVSRARFYVVQAGDNLTSIAAKTRVALTTLEALNPSLDPNSLQSGQRIRLRQ
jgi:spore germination protein YaaH